jgi:uncharacterized lipoprotein YmbA
MGAVPRSRSALLRSCLLLTALAGCAPGQPTRYYTLSTATEPAATAPRSGQELAIGFRQDSRQQI